MNKNRRARQKANRRRGREGLGLVGWYDEAQALPAEDKQPEPAPALGMLDLVNAPARGLQSGGYRARPRWGESVMARLGGRKGGKTPRRASQRRSG